MRRALSFAFVLGWLLGSAPATSRAQHCHRPAALTSADQALRLGLSMQAATYETDRYAGDYQSIDLHLEGSYHWVSGRAVMPLFWITRNGADAFGPGDLMLELRADLLPQPREARFRAGLIFSATLPTGSAEDELGMGHVMLMPAVFILFGEPLFSVDAQLGYGQALGAGEHHHGGPRPIVNPMNESELEGALSVSAAIFDALQLRMGAYGAVALGGEHGVDRAAVYAALSQRWTRFDLGIEGHLPLTGDPFDAKLIFSAGLIYP